ncbi:hypothetical protein NQ317_015230, partial [Molorchus minor]
MGGDKKDKPRKNKGVSTNKESLKDNTYFSDTDSCTVSLVANKSLNRVKNELQTVIDLMGPDTPHFRQTTSNEADTEESILSNVSIQFLKVNKTDGDISASFTGDSTDRTVPPDITLQEETDLSKAVDKNSSILELPETDFPQYICPPPLLPANVVFNSECICPQLATHFHQAAVSMPCMGAPVDAKKCPKHKNIFFSLFKSFKGKHNNFVHGKADYYSVDIKPSLDDHSPPRRLVFDLVGDVPKRDIPKSQCKPDDELKETYFNHNYDAKSKASKNLNNEKTKEYPPRIYASAKREC